MSTFGRVKDARASGRFIETIYQRVVQRFGEKEESHLTAKRLQGGNRGNITIRAKNHTSLLQKLRYALIQFKSVATAQLVGCEPRFEVGIALRQSQCQRHGHGGEVGVKWNGQRGCRASHFCTFGCLWVA